MNQIFLAATAVGALISLIAAFASKNMGTFINYILRFCMGATAIYFINTVLSMNGLQSGVGLNGVTLFTSSLLGFPGVLMMYGIAFYLNGGL